MHISTSKGRGGGGGIGKLTLIYLRPNTIIIGSTVKAEYGD